MVEVHGSRGQRGVGVCAVGGGAVGMLQALQPLPSLLISVDQQHLNETLGSSLTPRHSQAPLTREPLQNRIPCYGLRQALNTSLSVRT